MPYVLPVEGGEPIRIVGPNVKLPGWTVDEAWVAGLTDGEREAFGFVWSEDTDDERAAQLQRAIAGVKAEARARILTVLDEDQQRNAMMMVCVMVTTHGADPEGWPADRRAAHEATLPKLELIEAIRAASNEIEADLPTSVADLLAFDVAGHPAWPT